MVVPRTRERWVRLIVTRARARFFAGETIYFCPNKVVPGGPWQLEVPINGAMWLERAEYYRDHATQWKGSVEETAWQLAYNNWRHYAIPETGMRPHYYIRKEKSDDRCTTEGETGGV